MSDSSSGSSVLVTVSPSFRYGPVVSLSPRSRTRSFGPNTDTGSIDAVVLTATLMPLSTRNLTLTPPSSVSVRSSTAPTAMPRIFTSDLPGSRPCPARANVAV